MEEPQNSVIVLDIAITPKMVRKIIDGASAINWETHL